MKLLKALIFVFAFYTDGVSAKCYESTIVKPVPFMGNNGEVFVLQDGTVWEVKYEYEYLYEYYPKVIICPEKDILIIYENKLDVQQLR